MSYSIYFYQIPQIHSNPSIPLLAIINQCLAIMKHFSMIFNHTTLAKMLLQNPIESIETFPPFTSSWPPRYPDSGGWSNHSRPGRWDHRSFTQIAPGWYPKNSWMDVSQDPHLDPH
jgi:hypothetical protein